MNRIHWLIIMMSLLVATGCGSVAGNYPPIHTASASPNDLPTSCEWKDKACPVLWEVPHYGKMFFAQWDDPKIALKGTEAAARRGSVVAQRNAKEIKVLVDRNLIMVRVLFFYISEEELLLRQGGLELTFADGSVVKDRGVIFWEAQRNDAPKHDSRYKTLQLHKRWTKRDEPLQLRILIPRDYLGEKIVSVDFVN